MQTSGRRGRSFTLARAAAALAECAQEELGPAGAFERAVLEIFERHVGSETSLYIAPEPDRGAVTHHLDGYGHAVLDVLLHQAPTRYAETVQMGNLAALRNGIWIDHETYSATERRNLPLYRELFRPIRLSSTLLLAPRWRGVPLGFFGLHRYDGRGFTLRQRERALALVPALQLAWAAREQTLDAKHLEALTPREREVALQVARGLSTPQIAFLLGSSPRTVRNQLVWIFDKLGVASRSELAAYVAARRAGAPFRL